MSDALIGKRFRTLVPDYEEDDEYGEVMHPIGAEFVVDKDLGHTEFEPGNPRYGRSYAVAWQGMAIPGAWSKPEEIVQFIPSGTPPVPAEGMWTIWTDAEIRMEAEEVTQ